MSELEFLSPDRAAAGNGFAPILKSSMERRQRDAGARFEEREGWLVPVSFEGESDHLHRVGVADLSHLGKIEVRGAGEPPDGSEAAVWYQITPERALCLCPYPQTASLREQLRESFRLVVDQTAALAILALAGPEAPVALRRLTSLSSFPASGALAHVPAHVLEQNGSFWVVFPQEYGHYLWEVVVDTVEPLGGGPVGVAALVHERTPA